LARSSSSSHSAKSSATRFECGLEFVVHASTTSAAPTIAATINAAMTFIEASIPQLRRGQ
jgi:hypothetical protein